MSNGTGFFRGEKPWFKGFVLSSLSLSPPTGQRDVERDAEDLSGHHAQVVKGVNQRRELVLYDGKHSMQAALSIEAASKLDSDDEDTGITTSNLLGVVVALSKVLVVPYLHPSKAQHLCQPLLLLVDQVTCQPGLRYNRPASIPPLVEEDPQVMAHLRTYVEKGLSKYPTASTLLKQRRAFTRAQANGILNNDGSEDLKLFDQIIDQEGFPTEQLLANNKQQAIDDNTLPPRFTPSQSIGDSENAASPTAGTAIENPMDDEQLEEAVLDEQIGNQNEIVPDAIDSLPQTQHFDFIEEGDEDGDSNVDDKKDDGNNDDVEKDSVVPCAEVTAVAGNEEEDTSSDGGTDIVISCAEERTVAADEEEKDIRDGERDGIIFGAEDTTAVGVEMAAKQVNIVETHECNADGVEDVGVKDDKRVQERGLRRSNRRARRRSRRLNQQDNLENPTGDNHGEKDSNVPHVEEAVTKDVSNVEANEADEVVNGKVAPDVDRRPGKSKRNGSKRRSRRKSSAVHSAVQSDDIEKLTGNGDGEKDSIIPCTKEPAAVPVSIVEAREGDESGDKVVGMGVDMSAQGQSPMGSKKRPMTRSSAIQADNGEKIAVNGDGEEVASNGDGEKDITYCAEDMAATAAQQASAEQASAEADVDGVQAVDEDMGVQGRGQGQGRGSKGSGSNERVVRKIRTVQRDGGEIDGARKLSSVKCKKRSREAVANEAGDGTLGLQRLMKYMSQTCNPKRKLARPVTLAFPEYFKKLLQERIAAAASADITAAEQTPTSAIDTTTITTEDMSEAAVQQDVIDVDEEDGEQLESNRPAHQAARMTTKQTEEMGLPPLPSKKDRVTRSLKKSKKNVFFDFDENDPDVKAGLHKLKDDFDLLGRVRQAVERDARSQNFILDPQNFLPGQTDVPPPALEQSEEPTNELNISTPLPMTPMNQE